MAAEPRLDGLPLETMEHIAGHVADAHHPSLFKFSATSKACNKAARKFVFRNIRFKADDPGSLEKDVAAVAGSIKRASSCKLVRSLTIEGHLILREQERPAPPEHPARLSHWQTSWLDHIQSWYQRTGVLDILGDAEPHPYDGYGLEQPVQCPPDEDQAWHPLVRLVTELPYLTKMVYSCRNQFPPSLLAAIHTHHPRCKLHLLSFRLRSLRLPTPDPHEVALATSPCLHTIHLKHSSSDRSGEQDFNEHATLELVAGLAPNLKVVRTVSLAVPSPGALRTTPAPQPVVWKGLPGFKADSGKKGSLTSWSQSGVAPVNAELMQKWSSVTDFSCLRHLDLGAGLGSHSGVTINALELMVDRRPFPNLCSLRIRFLREAEDPEDPDRPTLAKMAADFFDMLEPLVELSVSGHMEPEMVDRMLARHGPRLRKLALSPCEPIRNGYVERPCPPMVFTRDRILRLRALCPDVEDLSIPVKRTRSDAREVELYRALGGFGRLRRLLVTLNCSSRFDAREDVWEADNPLFTTEDDHSDQDPPEYTRNGDLVNIFYNSAVDGALARGIWDVINASGGGSGGGGDSSGKGRRGLDSLKIYTTSGDDLARPTRYDDVFHVIENLSRAWLVERPVRDDDDDGAVAVRELGAAARAARDREYTRRNGGGAPVLSHSSALHNFHRMWPAPEGSTDWRDNWRSLPLQV